VAFYGSTPESVVLWEAQRHLPGMAPVTVQYHGTDITRARSAFPEIAEYLVCPWSFSQEE